MKLILNAGVELTIEPVLLGETPGAGAEYLRLPVRPPSESRSKLVGFSLYWKNSLPLKPYQPTPVDLARFEDAVGTIASEHGRSLNIKASLVPGAAR